MRWAVFRVVRAHEGLYDLYGYAHEGLYDLYGYRPFGIAERSVRCRADKPSEAERSVRCRADKPSEDRDAKSVKLRKCWLEQSVQSLNMVLSESFGVNNGYNRSVF